MELVLATPSNESISGSVNQRGRPHQPIPAKAAGVLKAIILSIRFARGCGVGIGLLATLAILLVSGVTANKPLFRAQPYVRQYLRLLRVVIPNNHPGYYLPPSLMRTS